MNESKTVWLEGFITGLFRINYESRDRYNSYTMTDIQGKIYIYTDMQGQINRYTVTGIQI